jgi:hypothetical protein
MDGMSHGLGGDQPGVARYYGKYPAIVMDEEPQAVALARGELLVQVPGILEETENGNGQQPIEVLARPSFPPGFYFLPEAGERIWVEFAAGDINTPLWTGVWYPDDMAPQTADAAAPARTQKIIRTQGGHVVQLDDGEDEKIVVHHKADSRLTIDKDGHILLEHTDGIKIEIAADHTITITADTIKLDGAVHITGATQIDGALTVGTGPSTTIDKNEITGG